MQALEQTPTISETPKPIHKCMDSKLSFFTDPLSPYHTAHPTVKGMFKPDQVDPKNIRPLLMFKKFQPRIGQTHICTRFFPNGVYYYTCRECCCQTKPGTTMCFCEPCWEADKHIGHNFRKTLSSGGAYCDCGREERIKPESFCATHSDKSPRVINFDSQQQKQFTSYYMSMLLCYFYLKINEPPKRCDLQPMLNKQLEQLCTASMYYIRLTTKLLRTPLQISGETRLLIEWLLKLNKYCEKLIFAMMGDNEFKILLIRTWTKLEGEGWRPENMRLVVSEMYETDDVFFQLAKEGHFVADKKKRYVVLATRSEEGVQLLKSFVKHLKQTLKAHEWPIMLKNFFEQQPCSFLINNRQIASDILEGFLCSQLDTLDTLVTADQKNTLIAEISKMLFCLVGGNIANLQTIYEDELIQKCAQELDRFLSFVAQNVHYYLRKSGQKKQTWLMISLLIIPYSQAQQKILTEFWKSFVNDQIDTVREVLTQAIALIYHLCAVITHSSIFLNEQALSNKKEDETQAQKEAWVRSYLYESGEVSRMDVLKLREKGLFKFPNSGQVFKELCTFVSAKDSFVYKSEAQYPNYVMRFKTNPPVKELSKIPQKNFRYSQTFNPPKKQLQTLLSTLFSTAFNKTFLNFWHQKFANNTALGTNELATCKSTNLGFYFLLTLVYVNTFTCGANEELRGLLEKLRAEKGAREGVLRFCREEDLGKVGILLEISEEEEQMEMVEKEEDKKDQILSPNKSQSNVPQQSKQKFHQKRQKLRQKFQKSTQKFLTKHQQHLQPHSQQFCIICRQPSKESDNLMYISNLQKNTSTAFYLHGQEDKSQVAITSCLHLIHSECFAGINKSGFDFNCPLCTRKSNIYLPCNAGDKKSLIRCRNLINAIQVSKNKNYEFNSLVFLLLRHLMGSYGLNSLIANQYFEKERAKLRIKMIDGLIMSLASSLADRMNEFQRQDLEEEMGKLRDELGKCKKEGLRLVQECVLTTLYAKLVGKQVEVDMKKLMQLRERMVEEEFMMFKGILQELTETEIVMPDQQPCPQIKKSSLNLQTAYPPSSLTQFKSQPHPSCTRCPALAPQPAKCLCLLCNSPLCSQCLSNEAHLREHNSSYLILDLPSMKLSIRQVNGKINGSHHVYFDLFMTPFEDRAKYGSQEEYVLNVEKMEKLVAGFLLRIQIK